jgi:nitroreductase
MDAIECILTRRSCRKYLDKAVEEDVLNKVLECARYAPSGKNTQNWHFIVISNKEVLYRISLEISKVDKRPNYSVTYGAPVLIIVTGKKDSSLSVYDGSCALENIFLGAHALGLSTCWIHQLTYPEVVENVSLYEYLYQLGLPRDEKVIGCSALGYAFEESKTTLPRKENTVIYVK